MKESTVIQKFLSIVVFRIFLVALSTVFSSCAKRAESRITFDHQSQALQTPEVIFLPISHEQKLFNDIVTLLSRILNLRYNIESQENGYDITFNLDERKSAIRVRKQQSNLEVSTQVEGKSELAKAINYYLLTGIFERQQFENKR